MMEWSYRTVSNAGTNEQYFDLVALNNTSRFGAHSLRTTNTIALLLVLMGQYLQRKQ